MKSRLSKYDETLASTPSTAQHPRIVRCDGAYPFPMGLEQFRDGLADRLSGLERHFANQRKTRLALDQVHDCPAVVPANDGIGVPVANAAPYFNDRRALLDEPAVRDEAAPVSLAIALLALLLSA